MYFGLWALIVLSMSALFLVAYSSRATKNNPPIFEIYAPSTISQYLDIQAVDEKINGNAIMVYDIAKTPI
jgi:hypothetical protein